jgi:hypothetical protein
MSQTQTVSKMMSERMNGCGLKFAVNVSFITFKIFEFWLKRGCEGMVLAWRISGTGITILTLWDSDLSYDACLLRCLKTWVRSYFSFHLTGIIRTTSKSSCEGQIQFQVWKCYANINWYHSSCGVSTLINFLMHDDCVIGLSILYEYPVNE